MVVLFQACLLEPVLPGSRAFKESFLQGSYVHSESGRWYRHSSAHLINNATSVYISKYSTCLDFKPWFHRSGYIAVFRLTKGRMTVVTENYTDTFTPPSLGFDCHVSEQTSTVSAMTSSSTASRTKYCMYELCRKGNSTAKHPRHACPFAIVGFTCEEARTTASPSQGKRPNTEALGRKYFLGL
ncbi:hypothetical protein AAFF_G00206220 [Aldrovandia affinis]|uniref:TASOR pseudo-PARP domain-containing protein n=1 Tax=Aldrovandia affinis TaxID=143900 RepID=A0AAD7RHN4_9TELE|nr:hypothetical protein AAFF_G00206220 [Aldrovandia affinis]